MFTIVRNNAIAQVGLSEIIESDLVLCADGRFYLVQSVSSLRSFLLSNSVISDDGERSSLSSLSNLMYGST